jgi:hypothetical protein
VRPPNLAIIPLHLGLFRAICGKMAPEEEAPKPETAAPETSGPRTSSPRGRRSGRGRRGHGRRPRPKPRAEEPSAIPRSESAVPSEDAEPIFELADELASGTEPQTESLEPAEPSAPVPSSPVPDVSPAPAGSQGSVYKAIEEVSAIVDFLRGALDDMEEVLEMLELFERQKNADEREIESLRRALRQMHRPREGGHQR